MNALKRYRTALWVLAALLFTCWALIGHKYRFLYNVGESMEPTLSSGEWVVAEKRSSLGGGWTPDRFDVVILLVSEGDKLTKRVIGIEGDIFEVIDGEIYINHKKLRDPYGKGTIDSTDIEKFRIPEGSVWVVGDNRSWSWYGLVGVEDVISLLVLY
jgi:signal peptidase I